MNCWIAICGDGYRLATEQWDDGNNANYDGWNSSWNVETNYQCSGGNSTTKDIWKPIWGDGLSKFDADSSWNDSDIITYIIFLFVAVRMERGWFQ